MGFVETSDTEGGGGRDGNGLDAERDWALAKRKDKRTVAIASWKIDVDIVGNTVVDVVEVKEGAEGRKRGGEPTLERRAT